MGKCKKCGEAMPQLGPKPRPDGTCPKCAAGRLCGKGWIRTLCENCYKP